MEVVKSGLEWLGSIKERYFLFTYLSGVTLIEPEAFLGWWEERSRNVFEGFGVKLISSSLLYACLEYGTGEGL